MVCEEAEVLEDKLECVIEAKILEREIENIRNLSRRSPGGYNIEMERGYIIMALQKQIKDITTKFYN